MKSNLECEASFIYSFIKYLWIIATIVMLLFFIANLCNIIKDGFTLDFSNIALKNFIELNEHIFKIPVLSTGITTILLGWITVKIYLSTYFSTHENNLNSQEVNRYTTYLKHYDNFLMMLEIKLKRLAYLSPNSIDKLSLYNFIFQNVRNGDLGISKCYKDFLENTNIAINEINNNLPKKIGYSNHIQLLVKEAKNMGIDLPEYERKSFIKIEHDFYDLINHINKHNNLPALVESKHSIH